MIYPAVCWITAHAGMESGEKRFTNGEPLPVQVWVVRSSPSLPDQVMFTRCWRAGCVFPVGGSCQFPARSESEIGWRRSESLMQLLLDMKSDVKGSESWRRIGMAWRFCAIGFYVFWKNNYFFFYYVIMSECYRTKLIWNRMTTDGSHEMIWDDLWDLIARDALLSGCVNLKSNEIRCRRRRWWWSRLLSAAAAVEYKLVFIKNNYFLSMLGQ